MSKEKRTVNLSMAPEVVRLAKVEAARKGITLSKYITALVEEDTIGSGVAILVREAGEEVDRDQR